MTWTVSINGHDDLSGDEKEALERVIVGESIALVESLKAQNGNNITSANVTTNTTGTVYLLNPEN
jgi:hypothetical protein